MAPRQLLAYTVTDFNLPFFATKNCGWLFCVKNERLTDEAIRLIKDKNEINNMELLAGVQKASDMPYINWGVLPYNGYMKAHDGDLYFNVKSESWKSEKPECYMRAEDGSYTVSYPFQIDQPIINGDLFDSLSDSERTAILEAAKEANALTRTRIEAQDSEQVEECRQKGMQVYAPNAEEMNQFREIGQPEYIKWLKTRLTDSQWLDMALRDSESANAKAQ